MKDVNILNEFFRRQENDEKQDEIQRTIRLIYFFYLQLMAISNHGN